MKVVKKALFSSAIALLALGSISISTSQAAPVSWSTGDVFLGFENSGHTLNYLYDLGAGSTFASALSGGTFSAVNLNADLSTVFGNGWATNGVSYGVFGLPSNKSIVYASVASGNTAPVVKASGALATTYSHYTGLGGNYNNDLTAQALTLGVQMFVGTGTDVSTSTWTGNNPSTAPFATYNVSFENLVSGNLDVYGTTGSTSTQLGVFTLSSAGALSQVTAVPEPSAYALLAMGSLILFFVNRRRSACMRA